VSRAGALFARRVLSCQHDGSPVAGTASVPYHDFLASTQGACRPRRGRNARPHRGGRSAWTARAAPPLRARTRGAPARRDTQPAPLVRLAARRTRMLGFTLDEEQEAVRLAVRDFPGRSLAPRVEELEQAETFPVDLFRELGRLGYLGVGYPEEYGGSGGDMVMRCLLIEEIARINCGVAAALLAHVGLGCIPLLRFGTEAQKREFLVPALRGEKLGRWGLSAPNSVSPPAYVGTPGAPANPPPRPRRGRSSTCGFRRPRGSAASKGASSKWRGLSRADASRT